MHGSGLAIRLLFMFAVLHWNGASLLGRFGLLSSIEVVAIYLAGFEFHAFTTRRYARRPSALRLRLCLASHRRMLLVSMPLAMIGSAITVWIFKVDLSPVELACFMIVIATGTVVQELTRFIILARNPLLSAVNGFIRTAIWQPIAVLFLQSSHPMLAIVIAWAAAAIISLVWGLWVLRRSIWAPRIKPPVTYLLHGFHASRSYYLMASASVVQGNLERFVLQAFLGPAAVGIFSFFQNLANTLPPLVQAGVLNVWVGKMLNQFGQRAAERYALLSHVSRQTLYVCLALSAGILAGAFGLAELTSHADYLAMIWILPVLLAGQTLQMYSQPLYLAFYGAHRDGAIMWLSLSLLALSLLLCVIFVKFFGMEGAVFSQLTVGIVMLVSREAVFRRYKATGRV